MKRWMLLPAAALLIIGICLYGRSLQNGFIELDDPLLITENPAAQSLTLHNLKTVFTSYDPELYIPLTFVSYQIDAEIGGLQPFVFKLHNLALHILNAWLFLMVAYALTKKRWVAVFAALLFLVHPIQSEAVLWASGRKDLQSMTFFLLSVLLYLRYVRRQDITSYAGSVGMFFLGLLSKVTVITLPVALLLIDAAKGRRLSVKSCIEKLPYFLLSGIFGVVALYGKTDAPHLSLMTRILIAARSLVFSIGTFFTPIQLSPIYADTVRVSLASPHYWIPLMLVVAMLAVIAATYRKWNAVAYGTAFVMLMFAPSFGNLVKGGEYYVTSDRYAYLPSLGIFLLAALALEQGWAMLTTHDGSDGTILSIARRPLNGVAIALIVLFSFLTMHQTIVWSNTLLLGRYITQVSPEARLGHLWYANALRDDGQLTKALTEYGVTLEFQQDAQVYYNRALAYEAKEETNLAMADYRTAITLQPSYALAHINLGKLLYLAGKKDDARKEFQTAADVAPHMAMPLFNLGVLDGEQKKFEAAAQEYSGALERDPTLEDARVNLILAYLALGKDADAVKQLKILFVQDPKNERGLAILAQLRADGIVK